MSTASTGVSAEFLRHFLKRCTKKFGRRKLEARATTHDVNKKIVAKATRRAGCSYIQLLQKKTSSSTASAHFGPANVFVSHAWRYRFIDVAQAMLDYQEDNPDTTCFFWFDLFVNDQNNATNNDFDWWCTTFRSSIESIGKVLLVLSPWNDPIPLTRAWCLWEIFCAADSDKIRLVVHLSQREREPFKQALAESHNTVMDTLVRVQAERAEATNPSDRDMIFKAIEATEGGFHMLNEKVKDQMREWLLSTANSFVAEMDADGDIQGMQYANMCRTLGLLLAGFGRFQEAADYFTRALTIHERLHGPHHLTTAMSLGNLGEALRHLGQHDKAIEYLKRGLSTMESCNDDSDDHADDVGQKHRDANAAKSYNNLAIAYANKGEFSTALEYADKTINLREAALGSEHPDTAGSHVNIGNIYASLGRFDMAVEAFMRAQRIYVKVIGENHPSTAATMMNIGSAYDAKGEHLSAIDAFRSCLRIRLATLGRQHPETAAVQMSMGNAYSHLGEYPQAVEFLTTALDTYKSALGEHHPDVAQAYSNLGSALRATGKLSEAIQLYTKALDIAVNALPEKHPTVANCYNNLGNALIDAGQLQEAVKCLERGLAIRVDVVGEDHPDTAASLSNLANAMSKMGQPARAVELYSASVASLSKLLGENHPQVAMVLTSLGNAYLAVGQEDDAVSCHNRSISIFRAALGADHPSTATASFNLGLAHEKRGDVRSAVAATSHALDVWTRVFGPSHPNSVTARQRVDALSSSAGEPATQLSSGDP